MTEEQLVYEIRVLIDKVHTSEALVREADIFFKNKSHQWRPEIQSYFLDNLERKRDQIDYEWHRIERLGQAIAAGRVLPGIDF